MDYTYVESEVSDLHKDAYGFRPSNDFWLEWNACDSDGKQELWDNMVESLNSND